jgi:enoyl-CoA hydratase/carnithine racemase
VELHVTEYTVEDHVAIVRLKRPDRGNSWTTRMNAEYRHLLARADADREARVIVVTGAGKQFCVGADFKALDHYDKSDADYVQSLAQQEMARPGFGVRPELDHDMVYHWGLAKTVIAAINGACAGIAVALAAFCDLRYGAAGARLTTATPRLGLPAEYGLPWILPRLVGLTHSADILLSGRVFTAEEAHAMGFLNAVFPSDTFTAEVLAIAKNIARTTSPAATMTAKRQLYADVLSHDVGGSVEHSKVLLGKFMKQPDFSEALAAMKEKRAPRFAPLSTPAES